MNMKMAAKKIRKIKPYGSTYWQRHRDLAGRFIGGCCKTCNSPLITGIICQYCGDCDPEQ